VVVNAAVQASVVGVLVVASALYALRTLAPRWSRRAIGSIAIRLAGPDHPSWMRSLARRLVASSATVTSRGSGCGSCGGCAPPSAGVQPPAFERAERRAE
jgi:hypothetical protein